VLWVASVNNHARVVKKLLEGGLNANVDGEWLRNIEGVETVCADLRLGRNYGTLLQTASARGHDEVVKVLLANGAVDVKGEW